MEPLGEGEADREISISRGEKRGSGRWQTHFLWPCPCSSFFTGDPSISLSLVLGIVMSLSLLVACYNSLSHTLQMCLYLAHSPISHANTGRFPPPFNISIQHTHIESKIEANICVHMSRLLGKAVAHIHQQTLNCSRSFQICFLFLLDLLGVRCHASFNCGNQIPLWGQ